MTEDILEPETILEPELAIIDPHHHLWDLRALLPMFPEPRHRFLETLVPVAHYTFDQFHNEVAGSGHNVRATVFMECGAFYNAAYGEATKVVGEVEYVNGVAAQSASGLYGEARLCAAIVGHADLMAGAAAGEVLDALAEAAPGRFRGIRHAAAWDADPEVLGAPFDHPPERYLDPTFREGFAELGKRGMSFDAWILEPQIPDVIDLARAFPDQPICLDHCGTPLSNASYDGRLEERFDIWRESIGELATCENVVVKLGGLAMHNCAMPPEGPAAGYASEALAGMWRPYIETCIDAFGTRRCMFESNYPVDRWGASYPVLWNAFKRITAGASADEKADLYAANAARFYAIESALA
ncbi:amidohydrolase family protein [Erythrobacter sp.]|jgi:predicted TIM-barrel fold metal-dependent hydrolase|uniref:amidohydrolase family protein n=1 Tax=Erythrobacter sp. TaxID=1042 RepID=UPI002E99837D|nr:amidohydrolase family protein [Erythrobacter sp.]